MAGGGRGSTPAMPFLKRLPNMRLPIPTCICFSFALAMTSPGLAADLDAHLWRERALLVFAPSASHPDYARLAPELDRRAADLDERQLVVYRLFLQGASRNDHKPLDAAVVEELRRSPGVAPGEATLILIGKDGAEKMRSALGMVDLDAVFRRIDAMPMRRLEMQRRQ